MQGLLIVVLGIALMYLVLSGKMDCLIAAFRACSATSATTATPTATPSAATGNPKSVLDNVLSHNPGV